MYFYFTFTIFVPSTGYSVRDYTVISTAERFFPLTNVMSWVHEEFGDDAQLLIDSVVEISAHDFALLSEGLEH